MKISIFFVLLLVSLSLSQVSQKIGLCALQKAFNYPNLPGIRIDFVDHLLFSFEIIINCVIGILLRR